MSSLRHPDWHIFAERRFRRRAGVMTTAQVFQGEPYIVLSDRITGQHVRLAARAQDLWRMLDGRRTAQQIWEDMIRRPATAPTQSELVDWFLQLAGSGLVLSDHEVDPDHLTDRESRRRGSQIEQRAASPLSIKVGLFDPDKLVRFLWPAFGWLFTRTGGLAIMALLLTAFVLAAMHWQELAQSADSLFLSQTRLFGVALTYPVMKTFHELAHCFALYKFGGKVRESGVMFLLLFPVPYVEASEATALSDKHARMLVGAAGILAELIMASIALIFWLMLEPGVERAILFNFMLLGTVSTILFNGNPLLKFDAYYVMADWLELPNLAQRAGAFLSDRFLWRICGLRSDIEATPRESWIFGLYGALSLGYRLLLTMTIALIVTNWFYAIGLFLGFWALTMGIIWPPVKLFKKGMRMAKAQNRTLRAALRFAAFVVVVGGLLFFVPLPFSAQGEGQIQTKPLAQITAGTTARVGAFYVTDGAQVAKGDVLLELEDSEARARLEALTLSVTYQEEAIKRSGLSPLERQQLEREIEIAREAQARAEERVEALTLRAPHSGRLAWEGARAPLTGSFVFRGDKLGEIMASDALELVIALPAAYSGIAQAEDAVDVRLPSGVELTFPISREGIVDMGGQVPEALLASRGGPIPEQPGNPGHSLDTVWLVWAQPDVDLERQIGMRFEARVKFDDAPAMEQIVFYVRRLFVRVIRV